MSFDPKTRRETRLFRELFKDPDGTPVYKQLDYALVSYNGAPEQYIEPLPTQGRHVPTTDELLDPQTDGVGMITHFEFFKSRPFEVHAFDDWAVS